MNHIPADEISVLLGVLPVVLEFLQPASQVLVLRATPRFARPYDTCLRRITRTWWIATLTSREAEAWRQVRLAEEALLDLAMEAWDRNLDHDANIAALEALGFNLVGRFDAN